ncbi:MAG: DUF3293 domain-containing protein [Thermoanaerobaculia bacterium]
MPLAPALAAAYRRTLYRVDAADGAFVLRVGELHPELDARLAAAGRRSWAWLTAVNPGSRRLPAAENLRRMDDLERRILAAGLSPIPGRAVARPSGSFPDEPSFLVPGATRRQASRWGRAFGQSAILAGHRGGRVELVELGERDGGSAGGKNEKAGSPQVRRTGEP